MSETHEMNTMGWRYKPFARAIVWFNCWLMVVTASLPLHAAPPAPNQLPVLQSIVRGANSPIVAGNKMTVNQVDNKAILNWQSFNIGKDATVQFNQPSASATALNRIQDGSPSQIFGRLSANGNVYLINKNGIVFGEGAQVNVHGLVASTLNINDNDFINSSLSQVINDKKAALVADPDMKADARVIIEAGAAINTDSGGQVLMFAPVVENHGDIATPNGQTILAASKDKVYLAASDKDQDLRGLLVEVNTGGDVRNVGSIVAERGNITLLGLAVNQEGRLRATTSVDVNGSIRLVARDTVNESSNIYTNSNPVEKALFLDDQKELPTSNFAVGSRTGDVRFGQGSLTEVVADESSGTAADAQPQNRSRIDVMAQNIEIGADARLLAKSGKINLIAITTPTDPYSQTSPSNPARISVGSGAVLDVSGEDVQLPFERRMIDVELRGEQLKDAPRQRNSVLRGKTVRVDVTKGSPLIADLGPELAKVKKDVKERMVSAGSVNFRSQGEVNFGAGASVNMSGGTISYAGGNLNTTKLLAANGRIVDIGDANPLQLYTHVFGEYEQTHKKWGKRIFGTNSVFNVGTHVDGYTEGADAGQLNIDTERLFGFDGVSLSAGAYRGINQRSLDSGPAAGKLDIVLGKIDGSVQDVLIAGANRGAVAHSSALALLSASMLNASGLDSFSLRGNGRVDLAADAELVLQPGAELDLTGTAIQIDGRIRIPSGAVALTTRDATQGATNAFHPIVFGAGSGIDVSGTWSNDRRALDRGDAPGVLALKGGAIKVAAAGDLTFGQGTVLRADAGAQLTSKGTIVGGDGGSIALSANFGDDSKPQGAELQLPGEFSAYGFGQGGSLTLGASTVAIGGTVPADPSTLYLDAGFFERGGFGSYKVSSSVGGVTVADNTVMTLQQRNWVAPSPKQMASLASGSELRPHVKTELLGEYYRNPVHLELRANPRKETTLAANPNAGLYLGRGAQLLGDNGAQISLAANGNLYVDGLIRARGGAIDLAINGVTGRAQYLGQSLWLGSNAWLDASSAFEQAGDIRRQQRDHVFDAGRISLTTNQGYLMAAPGSVLDVSARDYEFPLPLLASLLLPNKRAHVNAAAGEIKLRAADGLAVYSDLRGGATGDGLSGTLSYTLDANNRDEAVGTFASYPLEIHVAQNAPLWNGAWQFGTALPGAFAGKALVAADAVEAGGFGSLTLSAANLLTAQRDGVRQPASVVFDGDVELALSDALTLDATNIDVANHGVKLQSAIVQVGRQSDAAGINGVAQQKNSVSNGSGRLTLLGNAVEIVGNVGISGAATTRIGSRNDLRVRSVVNAENGQRDLKVGELAVAGDLVLEAAALYPATLSAYTIKAGTLANPATLSVTNAGAGTPTPLLSAGGRLSLQAASIELGDVAGHGARLAAPLGTVELSATDSIHLFAGSTIDVSAHDLAIPFGRLRGGDLNWIYPINSDRPLVIDRPPEKAVVLTAPSVAMDAGARVDLSGGGDIYAFEHVPGPGGSQDFLDVAYADGAFAVVPWLNGYTAPYDIVEMRNTGIALGSTVWLDGANGLPAGNYAILPAHYALLAGAYLITPKGEALPGVLTKGQLADGTQLVTGRQGRGYSGQHGNDWRYFAVEKGDAARTRSQYTEFTGSEFFADRGVDLAADAGRMAITAQRMIDLQGTINATAQNGRRAQLDIVADKLAVVADLAYEAGAGVVKLAASGLNNLGVDSLMLGGRRSRDGDDTNVQVGSAQVTVEAGANLGVPDLVLTAKDRVEVRSGATIAARGDATADTRAFKITGDGALLRVSSARQSNVVRTTSPGAAGDLTVANGATLAAASLLLDASHAMSLPGALSLTDGSLNISANQINLGDVPSSAAGVSLSQAKLNSLGAKELMLSSRNAIDFYGDIAFANTQIVLNTNALRSVAGGDVRVAATDSLTLRNAFDQAPAPIATSGAGALTLAARDIQLGDKTDAAATMALGGFASVDIGAAGKTRDVKAGGDFSLQADNLDVVSDRISAGASGIKTAINAQGDVTLSAAGAMGMDSLAASALGASFDISGKSISANTTVALPSGVVSLFANGADSGDGVLLGSGAKIDVAGRAIAFPHGAINTDSGDIKLATANGNIAIGNGAELVLSGADASAQGGTLTLEAANGTVVIDTATVTAGNSGALRVDIDTLASPDALIALAKNGFNRLFELRQRSGDLAIASSITAHEIQLEADGGSIALGGGAAPVRLDARGDKGGNVSIYAKHNLVMNSDTTIDASAARGRGGRVEIGTTNGELRFENGSRIAFDAGANDQRGGFLMLRSPRIDGDTDVAVIDNGVAVTGAETVQLAAVKSYSSNSVAAVLGAALSDADAFMANEAAVKGRLAGLAALSGFHLAPEIEITSTGGLTVDQEVNFAADADFDRLPDYRFGASREAPILTLRAAADLNVDNSLLDGAVVDQMSEPAQELSGIGLLTTWLLEGESGSFRVVAGADLDAANPNITTDSGDLYINNGADLKTGTGWIKLAAGGDIAVTAADSAIVSLGKTTYSIADGFSYYSQQLLPDTGTFNALAAYLGAFKLMQYPEQGGDIDIAAKGDIDFGAQQQYFGAWLERLGGEFEPESGSGSKVNLTTWGALVDFIRQGVVAFGGDVGIDAGGNISHLNASLPTTGKQVGVGENQVQITRAGDLAVSAGGGITSARIMAEGTSATLRAGGAIAGADTGLNTIAALGDTKLNLVARGDIAVDAVFNTTAGPQGINQSPFDGILQADRETYFFTYGADASVSLNSVGGDIQLLGNGEAYLAAIQSDLPNRQIAGGSFGSYADELSALNLYPGSVRIEASAGDVQLQETLLLYPSPAGQLSLFAGGDVFAAAATTVIQSDADPRAFPSIATPARILAGAASDINTPMKILLGQATTSSLAHAPYLLHGNDAQGSIVDALGDIRTDDNARFNFVFAEKTQIAANDLTSVFFSIQNNRDSDVSEIVLRGDLSYPLLLQSDGTFPSLTSENQKNVSNIVYGPGRLDVLVGADISLGASYGFVSSGNSDNPYLPDNGTDMTFVAGLRDGVTALTDKHVSDAFAAAYLSQVAVPASSYIEWFGDGGFTGDIATLMATFTGESYASRGDALDAFRQLPVLTQQGISLEAYRARRDDALAGVAIGDKTSYEKLRGYGNDFSYSADLIDFVSFERFGGDLISAVAAVTGVPYATNRDAAAALAAMPAAQQQAIAKTAYLNASVSARRELTTEIFFSELRRGGIENAKGLVQIGARDGFSRSNAAIANVFPGNAWRGDLSLVFSGLISRDDGDINFFTPGGKVDVGLAGQFAGFKKEPANLGLIAQRYGQINGFARDDIAINQSRIFSLDGADITLWSSFGDIDAGKGAKTALSIPPPTTTVDENGNIVVEFPAAVAGSGIQTARNERKRATDNGAAGESEVTLRDRVYRSLAAGDVYLFAPQGAINAGDAGISVGGNLLLAAQRVVGADNISVGGVSIGVPTTTSVSAGTLSMGNSAASATEAATGSMNDAIKQTAAALAESKVAFVTVDVIGIGRD